MNNGNFRLGDLCRNRPKETHEGYLAKITVVLGSRSIFVGPQPVTRERRFFRFSLSTVVTEENPIPDLALTQISWFFKYGP